ncbi:nitric oxide synthase 1-like isoform X1 [Saccostrea cucullata]|uniref:nitric oxide synthase 1-like isoform X1 n=1 Tax=Saccostrea cuccullata TaxID=36930 RepID=UPI002ED3D99B
MEDNNLIRVKLIKRRQDGLGFLIRPRKTSPFVSISALVAGGMAEQSGLVQVGDVITRVNEIDISETSYENAVELLKALPIDAPVALLLRGPDGYTTHLETTFLESGVPKTIRVTKVLPTNDSLVGRIRRTFSRSRSQSPSNYNRNKLNRNSNKLPNSSAENYLNETTVEENCFMCPIERHFPMSSAKLAARSSVIDAGVQTSTDSQSEISTPHCNGGSPSIVVTRTDKPSQGQSTKEDGKVIKSKEERDLKRTTESDTKDSNTKAAQQGMESKATASPTMTLKVNGTSQNGHTNGFLSDDESHSPSTRRKRPVSANSAKKFVKIRNVADEKIVYTDTLHTKSLENVPCTSNRCMGSIMGFTTNKRAPGEPRPKEEVLLQARDFIEQYYTSIKRINSQSYHKRLEEVVASIEKTGTYELTSSELTFGAKTAWRNAPRCIGRIQWNKLQVFDARHITTARGMFEAICNHIKYGTNKGNIRSAITIFPPRTDGKHDFRVWNAQLIRYAGYKQPDGSIIGDPANVEFTEVCQKMGWKGKGGMWDVLPLVLQANGMDPEMFEIPSDLILEVLIKHPKFPWLAEMGIRWYALPAVSCIMFDCGGLEFTAAPFNGWFMGTEIGARDLCDVQRYNLLKPIAEKMGLDTKKNSSLWKDRALVEINIAVLYSYQQMGVTITDHHAASESFMKHMENEQKTRGGCPADWVWVVPPMSGSLTEVFHQEMLLYKLKPSYEYMDDPWKTHVWKKDRDRKVSVDRPKRKFGFRELARAVKFSAKLMGKALARRVKCTILYATETGKSERFARSLCEIFKHAFDAKVMNMEDYDPIYLEHEQLLLVVTSTFGNGDPPENGEAFAKSLHEMKSPQSTQNGEPMFMSYFKMSTKSESDDKSDTSQDTAGNLDADVGPLANVHYSVFGLGSRAYPNFCAFAHFVDNMINSLGGMRIHKMMEGDELCGQEESFRQWAEEAFKSACETFCVGDDSSISEATSSLSKTDFTWSPGKFRLTPADKEPSLIEALSKVHNKTVIPCKLIERTQLQSPDSSRQTILVKMDTGGAPELAYAPGDHVAIFPTNSSDMVESILSRLQNAPSADQIVKTEILQEKSTPLGSSKAWEPVEKIPVCSLRTAFSRFLDITTPPSVNMLKQLASQATRESDKNRLENLANDIHAYEDWKHERNPNLVEVFEEFPSLRVNPTLLMTQLPLLQQRFYSISSSPKAFPGEIHATVAVVRYNTMGGVGPVHEGVCSSWLNKCDIGESIPCVVRMAPSFHLPDDATLPVVMVGPGTGIAPFRSFWQQRKIEQEMLPPPSHGEKQGWGRMSLYFGCRQSTMDHIYEAELSTCAKEGVLYEVHVALSREPGKKKEYVQDLLKKNSQQVFNSIMKEGGHFYVCGDVGMASDVTTTLAKIIQEHGKMAAEKAQSYLLKLKESNRFHEDIFGVTVKAEVTDRARDQAKKAWKYINSTNKTTRTDEVVTRIPSAEIPIQTRKPRPPSRNRSHVGYTDIESTLYESSDSMSPEH